MNQVKELSIFIDESGDFGEYSLHSPYYIVSFVFHDRSADISNDIQQLNGNIKVSGFPETPIHTGPLIRREDEYKHTSLSDRKRIFNLLYNFMRKADITHYSVIVEKKQLAQSGELNAQIAKQLSAFLNRNLEKLIEYDVIKIYYDDGQPDLTDIIDNAFTNVFSNVEFKRTFATDYKLFQAADMICTLELLNLKLECKALSNSEISFFTTGRDLHKSYLKPIRKKKIDVYH